MSYRHRESTFFVVRNYIDSKVLENITDQKNINHRGPRSPVVLPPWGMKVGCSIRVEGEACPGPVKRYRQKLAPGLGGGPQGQHLVKKKKKKRRI